MTRFVVRTHVRKATTMRFCNLFPFATVSILLLLFVGGCSKRQPAETATLEAIEKLGTLPGLRQTHDRQLKSELARLVAEKATPELLQQERAAHAAKQFATATQVLTQLNRIVSTRDLKTALQRIDSFYPAGPFHFDPVALRQALDMEQLFVRQRHEYVALVTRPGFEFQVDLMRGLLADMSFVEHAKLAQRLLALTIADSLAGGDPAAAVLPLRQMLTLIHKLAGTPSLAARSAAARLRGDTLAIVQAVILHPHCAKTTAAAILDIVKGQLANWTPDRVTWIGDRALGLHCYEMVRDGRLLSLLTENEIKTLKAKKRFVAFVEAVTQSVDNDERFYLAMMRQIIAVCDKPYFARASVFEHLHQQLNSLQDTPRYPLFAARVLIPGIEPGQQLQALDRARCEAWVLALSKSLGATGTAIDSNPLTGKPYAFQRTEDRITVCVAAPNDREYVVQVPAQWHKDTARGPRPK